MGYKSKISDSHEPDISYLTKTLTNIRERYCSTVSYIVLQIYAPFPDYQTNFTCYITVYLLVRLLVYVLLFLYDKVLTNNLRNIDRRNYNAIMRCVFYFCMQNTTSGTNCMHCQMPYKVCRNT